MRDPQDEPSDLIRSVSRALRVLESVGGTPRGLTVKQIARRCELTVATTYHLVRTLAYEGYIARREDGTYVVGLEIADRYHELREALGGPPPVTEVLRRAAQETGYSHYLGRFIGNRVVLTAVAEGPRSPHLEDLIPGFDEGAHATALGKALLATLTPSQRQRYLREWGMRQYTSQTLVDRDALEADLVAGDKRAMQWELGQYRTNLACAAMTAVADRDQDRRLVVACAMSPQELATTARGVRAKLVAVARDLAAAQNQGQAGEPPPA